jgi:hypothetical protein
MDETRVQKACVFEEYDFLGEEICCLATDKLKKLSVN